MGGQRSVTVDGVGGDARGQVPGGFAGFGGVFREVSRDGGVSQFFGEVDRPDVKLGTPGDGPALRIAGMRRGAEGGGHCGLYLVTRSLDPTGTGSTRWTMRWKPVINAFTVTFGDRWPAAETY